MRLLVAFLAALIFVPAAFAWLPVSPTVPGSISPSVARLRSNTELVAYSDGRSTLRVVSSGSGTHTIATGLTSVGQPAIVQTGNAEELYAPAADGSLSGVLRWESKNDGFTWTGPFQTAAKSLAPVASAAVLANGTPLFVQGAKVYQGLSGESSQPVAGSAASVVVDSTNRAQVVFWSIAKPYKNRYVLQSVGKKSTAKSIAALNTGALPVAADASGDTFVGWAASAGFTVGTFRAGKLVRSTLVGSGKLSAPHLSLAVDSANRLWAIWSQGGTIYAKRSRDGGKTFGAATSFSGSSTSSIAASAQLGQLDVFANDGHELSEQTFLPGLTVNVAGGSATVLDDGVAVNFATLTAGTTTAKTDATGKASLTGFPSGAAVTVTASGYAAASFTSP